MTNNVKIEKIVAILLAAVVILGFSCVGGAEVVAPGNVLSIPGWETSSPEAQGLDSELLQKAVNVVMKNEIHGLVIARKGVIVSETYKFPGAPDTLHEINSCTKSITSTLVGIAIDKGYIESVDQSIWDFFPEVDRSSLSEMKQKITIKDLLTMSGGFEWNEIGSFDGYRRWLQEDNHVESAYSRELMNEPGKVFNYDTLQSHLLSAIIARGSGQNTLDFARQYLFGPLGITNFEWYADDAGIPWGGAVSYFTTRDMARLGQLHLNQGVWQGERIVSSEWIVESGKGHIETDAHTGSKPHYGYQFWVDSANGYYAALGYGGQQIIIIPELDIVVAATSYTADSLIFSIVENYVIPAVLEDGSIKSNPQALTVLRDLERETAIFHEAAVEVKPVSEESMNLAGKTYVAEEGSFWSWKSIRFDFEDGANIGTFFLNDKPLEVGMDTIYRFSQVENFRGMMEKTGYKGYWKNDTTFMLEMVREVGTRISYKLRFMDDKVIVMWKEPHGASSSMTLLAVE